MRKYVIAVILATSLIPMNVTAMENAEQDIDKLLNIDLYKEKQDKQIEVNFKDRLEPITLEDAEKVKERKVKATHTVVEYGSLYTNVGKVIHKDKAITDKPQGVNSTKNITTTSKYENKPLELTRKHSKNGKTSYLFKSKGKEIGWIAKEDIEIGQNDIAYVMRKGDTLEDVAKHFDKTVEYLRLMNGLGEKDKPSEGDTIKLVLGITETTQVGSTGDLTQQTKPARSTQEFINRISKDAQNLQEKYDVLPSVIMAQAILESRNGTSGLATVGNNLFGIKGMYNGDGIVLPTLEEYGGYLYRVNATFRKYPSWTESLEDHSKLLAYNSRYARVIGQQDYQLATMGLQEAGYATDTNYSTKLNQIIAIYGLTEYDE